MHFSKSTLFILSGLLAMLLIPFGSIKAQSTILSADFSTCEGNYSEFGAFSDGSSDYFMRTTGSADDTNCVSVATGTSGDITYSNVTGHYYVAEDVDRAAENPNTTGEFGSTALTSGVHFNDIDISEYSNIQIVCSFASSGNLAYESGDYIRIYIDKTNNGTYELLGAFESTNGLGNTTLSQDTDLDGNGDGTVLSAAFQSFTFNLTGATTMDVRIEVLSSGSSEEMAFDEFSVQGSQTTWNGSTWSDGTPDANTAAIIASSTTPGTAITCGHLVINSGITLNMGANDLNIAGNLINSGNGISSTGTITFNASGEAQISGNAVSHESVVSISSGTTLTTNSLLTLTASSASSYGQLVGDGSVTGDVNVQAYLDGIDGSTARYFYLGSPVTNTTLNDFNEGNTMVASASNTGTTWQWDASNAIWDAPSSLTNAATSGQGFAIYAGTNTFGTFIRGTAGTIQLTGTVTTSDVGRAISYNNGQGGSVNDQGNVQSFVGSTEADTEGWNLVANPYPAVYDWDGQTIPTDMSSAIYRFDGSNYTSYTKGAGSASRYIPPFQGFFVQLAANTPGTLTFAENNRVTGQSATLGKKSSFNIDGVDLFIHNQSSTVKDQLFIGYDTDATASFDLKYDAHKLSNSSGVPSIFTRFTADSYSICRVNQNDGITSFPVYIQHAIDGESMYFDVDLSRLQSYSTVKLEDLKTGNIHDLKNSDYHFIHDASFKQDRFKLYFVSSQTVSLTEVELSHQWFAYAGDNGIEINTGELSNPSISVRNISGQLVYQKNAENRITSIPIMDKGVYVITVGNSESSSSKKIIY